MRAGEGPGDEGPRDEGPRDKDSRAEGPQAEGPPRGEGPQGPKIKKERMFFIFFQVNIVSKRYFMNVLSMHKEKRISNLILLNKKTDRTV